MNARGDRCTLVIHPGALGDVLQAVPALRALRAAGARLTFAGQPRLASFLAGAGAAQAALGFDGLGLEALFTREPIPPPVRERLARFDRVVSWFGSQDDVYPERLSEVVRECVMAPPVPGAGAPVAVWRHLLGTLVPWGVSADERPAPLAPPEPWRVAARRALAALGAQRERPLLVIHPGAGGEWKRAPAPLLAEAIQSAIGERMVEVLIHQGPADRQAADELAAVLGLRALRLVEPELPLLAGILGEAAAYLGSDSGVSHLAAAVGAPAVILFPAAMLDRWRPWSPTAVPVPLGGRPGEAGAVTQALTERLDAAAVPPDNGATSHLQEGKP